MDDALDRIDRAARTRLLDLSTLYGDLAEMRPTDRDDLQDGSIAQREEELLRVLALIESVARYTPPRRTANPYRLDRTLIDHALMPRAHRRR